MLLKAKHRSDQFTADQSCRGNIPSVDSFIQRTAGSDRISHNILNLYKIKTIDELKYHLNDCKRQVIFLKRLNKMMKAVVLFGAIGLAGYSYHEYQAEYFGRIEAFQKTLVFPQIPVNAGPDILVRGEQPVPGFIQRDIFRPVRKVSAEPQHYPDTKVKEFIQTYKIVGIVVDSQRRAIVENLRLQETVFLSIGDQIGEATVTKIQADKIVCQLEGYELELLP